MVYLFVVKVHWGLFIIAKFAINDFYVKALKAYFPVFKFVFVFASIYINLSLLYYFFLSFEYSDDLYPDPVTATVAYQTQQLLSLTSYESHILNAVNHPSVVMYLNRQIVYNVIEGCNSISVMVLFASFVFAFAKAWKKTTLFILSGLLIIYIINILRLASLAIIKFEFPQYDHISHDIVFPSIIYGTVILLWLYWLKNPKAI